MAILTLPYLSVARLWAMETIDNVFTGEIPKNAVFHYNDMADMATINENTTLIPYRPQQLSRRHTISSTTSSLTTVSTSSLSSAPTNDEHNDCSSTPGTNTFSFGSSVPNCLLLPGHYEYGVNYCHYQQQQSPSAAITTEPSPLEPSYPRRLSRRSTITSSLKRRLTLDESTSINIRRLFISEQLQKERRAYNMWQETLHEYLLDPAFHIPTPRYTVDSPRLAHCIISELLSTEETYLGHLSMFKQVFIDPFSQQFQNQHMVRDLQTIFSHIPQLISLSSTLVGCWRMVMEQKTWRMNDTIMGNQKNQDIGKAFCDLEDEFKVYIYYAVHYAKAQKCIARMEQKSSYRQWMHTVLQKKELQRMELADYLISPIQRITRYCLLIKDLIKHTDGYTMELERTLKYLTSLAVVMNSCQQ